MANAGLSRYAGRDTIKLDGTSSYDPNDSGSLSYAWRQISGPPVVITGADTPTPTISDFLQTGQIQECEFELIVNDGQSASSPDMVKVVIVPSYGADTLKQQNPPFDANKPTVFYFSGGDCVNGFANEQPWGNTAWFERANIINFPAGYVPDPSSLESWRTYYRYGDMIIVYLSSVAPDYGGMIQIMG